MALAFRGRSHNILHTCNYCVVVVCCVQVPATPEKWTEVASEFALKWNFPACIGALDGKHVAIKPPGNSGSMYYNYKHFHTVVLMALVDASYRFLFVDVGSYGRVADGGVFNNCALATRLENNSLGIPHSVELAGVGSVPFVIVADDAFGIKSYLMKPYPLRGLTREQRIFNYRLCRARRVVENAFGILSQRFRLFSHAIELDPSKVETATMAACCLYNNFLLRNNASAQCYTADISVNDEGPICSHNTFKPMQKQGSNHSSRTASEIRGRFCAYFNSEAGSVPWQEERCML